ncbi:uncharacterized protein VICG_02140, partial [Vittaforma corneae ATCC 50505]
GFDFDHIPMKTWKFLTDHCGTEELHISKTAIDVAALNSPDLSKITMLALFDVGLTEMPCLYNLKSIKYLCLNNNQIGHVNLQSYFDAETSDGTMPKLEYLDLCGNHISKIDARIKEVCSNKSAEIGLDRVGLCSIHGNMKDKLDKVGIELVEPVKKKENAPDVKN